MSIFIAFTALIKMINILTPNLDYSPLRYISISHLAWSNLSFQKQKLQRDQGFDCRQKIQYFPFNVDKSYLLINALIIYFDFFLFPTPIHFLNSYSLPPIPCTVFFHSSGNLEWQQLSREQLFNHPDSKLSPLVLQRNLHLLTPLNPKPIKGN